MGMPISEGVKNSLPFYAVSFIDVYNKLKAEIKKLKAEIKKLNTEIDEINARTDNPDAKNAEIDNLNAKINKINAKTDSPYAKIVKITKIDSPDAEIAEIDEILPPLNLAPGGPTHEVPPAVLNAGVPKNSAEYASMTGLPELIESIQELYKYGYDGLKVQGPIVTAGGSAAILAAIRVAFNNGANVIITPPTYPAYLKNLEANGMNPVQMPVDETTGFQPTVEMLQKQYDESLKNGEKIDGLIICSPSNPTGAIIDKENLKAICDWCNEHDVRLLSDEAYHGMVYEGDRAYSALEFSETAVVFETFSKYWGLPGARVGWLASHDAEFMENTSKYVQSAFVGANHRSQWQAVEALKPEHRDHYEKKMVEYKVKRDFMIEGLISAGFNILSNPAGALYICVDTRDFGVDSLQFAEDMINDIGVFVAPGIDFDQDNGEYFCRKTFAGSEKTNEDAGERLRRWALDYKKAHQHRECRF